MEEKVQVKAVEGTENVSTQEKEAAILQEAIESGEVDSNYGFQDDGVYRVNIDSQPKQKEDAIQEQETTRVSVDEPAGDSEKVDEEVRVENTEQQADEEEEITLLEEITEEATKEEEKPVEKTVIEKVKTEDQVEEIEKDQKLKIEYPEQVQKLIDFMNDTGGSLEDYVNLNRDYSKMNNTSLVYEYLKNTKPHLDNEDINFLMQKEFSYDEEEAEPSEIRAKQLAFKEKLYEAQKYFNTSKEKYYADLKLRKQNDIPEEYTNALEYYKQQQLEKENWEAQQKNFLDKTNKVFNEDFKGFDFQVENKKFRFKVENKEKIKEYQSDLKNFINEFVDKDGNISDASSYHKALFAGRNADKIAAHFYEQGRADAIKMQAKEAKNIDMTPRTDNSVITTSSGDKIRVVSGDSSDKLRIKWK